MARRESKATKTNRLNEILDRLAAAYPDARVGLDFTNPLELLIATILSAQCTDERVNMVTPALFAKYKTATDYALAPVEQLEEDIRSTGFYKNKARHIRECCLQLQDRFGGQVPKTLEELVTLPGVGRKTANCVLSNCFEIPGLTVDTHVTRISNLLGFVSTKDAVKIEFALMEILDSSRWNEFDRLIINHGRRACIALRPRCSDCVISDLCPSAQVSP
ncbi:MAG: endonuclease III [Candidatus Kapabacteria bacterium]|nr:endonuclease III [Candidatus Kapabacteria bacterium]